MEFFRFWHLPSNDVIAKIVFRDFDLHFQFQMFKTCEIRSSSYVFRIAKIFEVIRQLTLEHLQSNAVSLIFSSVILTCIFDLKF